MTVITVGTVGYAEVEPLTTAGRIFTMLLIFAGFGAMFFFVGTMVEFVLEGHLREFLEGRRMKKLIEGLHDHHIVAGTGRVGSVVARSLAEEGAPFIIIDQCEDCVTIADERGWPILHADATDEGVLRLAGVERARSLISTLDTDADNLFVTFTARSLNSDIFIVARSTHETAEEKIRRAGANRVITPNEISGQRMATMVLHPVISDYLDLVTHGDNVEYRLQEFELSSSSAFAGKTIKEAHVRDVTGAYILAIQDSRGMINTNPPPDSTMNAGDRLVAIGTESQLEALEKSV
jgi:voltage-gated potassium channel